MRLVVLKKGDGHLFDMGTAIFQLVWGQPFFLKKKMAVPNCLEKMAVPIY